MKAATATEIKQKLKSLDHGDLLEICLRLSRFKKENKELLTYLLFEADDPELYVKHVKEELGPLFKEVNPKQVYFAKKTIRKILRMARRFIRYSGSKTAEAEILLYFLAEFKDLDLPMRKNPLLQNIYQSQVKKIQAAVATMHEDLQHDYEKQLQLLL